MSSEKANIHPGPSATATMVVPAEGQRVQLLVDGTYASSPFNTATAAFGAGALPASGAWLRSQVIGVRGIRHLDIGALYNAHASTTTGYAQLLVFYSCQYTQPLTTDDVWTVLSDTDGALTLGALATGTLPTSNVITRTGTYAAKKMNPVAWNLAAATANSDKLRQGILLNVEQVSWIMLYAREAGDTTNTGTLDLWLCGSV